MVQIGILILATALTIGWLVLSKKYGDKYNDLIATIDTEIYRYPELFFVGFGIMELIHFNMRSDKARKRIHEISEINGKKYAEYYYYVTMGAEFTYGYIAMTGLMVLAGLSGDIKIAGLAIVLGVLAAMYMEQEIDNKLSDRRDEMLADFPQILSKLALLVNSGMVMREAWNKVAVSGERVIYKEMQITMEEFHNGVSELEAYRNFAERCGIKEIRRFASTMIQNLQKGNAEVAFFLREMSDEMWEEKKHLVKRKGEAANSKLMVPSLIIFIGILVMIMVPAFSGL